MSENKRVNWPTPWWGDETYSGKLIPYSELGPAGSGALVAEAIHERLRTGGHSEDVSFSFAATGKPCMNCGATRREVAENGGRCNRCPR